LEDRSAEGTWSNPTATLHAKECKYPPKEEAVSEGTVDAEKDAYQELFNYFHREHDILLLESDMQEVIRIVQSKPAEAVTDEAIRDAVHEAFWGWVADKEKGADERLKEKIVSIVLAGLKHSSTEPKSELKDLLVDVHAIFAGWMNDECWTEWDESVRRRVVEMQFKINKK
jgi:hypothetical protein